MNDYLKLLSAAWLAVICGVTLCVLTHGQDRKTGKAPDIAGPSIWGIVEVKGRAVTITGHSRWEATGTLRADGKLQITWIETETGFTGPGLYVIVGRIIEGRWGWATTAEFDEFGNLVGATMADTIRARE